jgi:16S rRNA (uracil1498-N3)-methyltransferase
MVEELTEPGGSVRLYVETPLGAHLKVTPGDAQSHYLLHVMRAKSGDRLRLFNGRDGEWLARVGAISKRGCTLECEAQTTAQHEVPDLWLLFAPIKKSPSDYLAQKATELGVRVLQPVITRRTIARRVNIERMRANAIEAAEQSGRVSVPETREPVEFGRLLSNWAQDRNVLFCDEAGEAPPIAEALQRSPAKSWSILTGPEGGFDPAERAALRALANVVPVSLGRRILRADTAALAALAVWQALKGEGL